MEKKEIAQRIKAFLSKDKLEDACNLIKNTSIEFVEDIIQIQGDLAALESSIIHNTINQGEALIHRSKIRSRISKLATKIKKQGEIKELLEEVTDSISEIEASPGVQKVKEAVELLDYWKSAGELLAELRKGDKKGQKAIEIRVVEIVCNNLSAKIQSEKEELVLIFNELLDFIQSRLLSGDDIDEETFNRIYKQIRPSRRGLFVLFFEEFQREIQKSLEMNLSPRSLEEVNDIFKILKESIGH